MFSIKSTSSFRSRLSELIKVRRKVYAGVDEEIKREFTNKSIDQVWQNNDVLLYQGDLKIIKLRLPDKKHHLSRKDGFRLIYLVSKPNEVVIFLDIYPKNGPLQQLDIADDVLRSLVREFVQESNEGTLEDFL